MKNNWIGPEAPFLHLKQMLRRIKYQRKMIFYAKKKLIVSCESDIADSCIG